MKRPQKSKYTSVKEANLKRLRSVWIQLCRILEKTRLKRHRKKIMFARAAERGEKAERRLRACTWSCSVISDSLRPHGLLPPRRLCPWDSPSKNTGGGCMPSSGGSSPPRDHALRLPYWQAGSLPLVPPGKPRMTLKWWAYVTACLSKLREYAPPRVNLSIIYTLGAFRMPQCRFTSFKKRSTLTGELVVGRSMHAWGQRTYGKFFCEPKTSLKN